MRLGRGLVLASAALVAACSSGSAESAAEPPTPAPSTTAATTTSTTTAPATTTTTTTTTTPPPVAETDVDVLAAFVEERSGFDFEDPPEVREATITRDELGADPGFFVDEQLWDLFVPLGLVEPDDDRIDAGQARLDQVRGVCCPVLLFETDDHPLLESVVVVHELTHLLDRQRPFQRGIPSDEPLRFDVIVLEGNAQRVALDYQAELEEQGADPSLFDFDWSDPRIPPAVLEAMEFPYEEGAVLSAALAERGGIEAAAEPFERPPVSAEQVLDVEAYLDDERPVDVPVPVPPGGATTTGTGTMGSFVLRELALRTLPSDAAHALAIAWAGDRYALFERAGRSCIIATVVMDDPSSASAMTEALRGAGVGAVVDLAAATEVTVRRCAEPASSPQRRVSAPDLQRPGGSDRSSTVRP